jgi:hypothetical protein
MAIKRSTSSAAGSAPFGIGQIPIETGVALQKELLDAYEKAGRAWLARMKSEVELWSELAAKLAAVHSVPEALDACTKSASKQMQMAAEDGQRLLHDCEQITQRMTEAVSNGRQLSHDQESGVTRSTRMRRR